MNNFERYLIDTLTEGSRSYRKLHAKLNKAKKRFDPENIKWPESKVEDIPGDTGDATGNGHQSPSRASVMTLGKLPFTRDDKEAYSKARTNLSQKEKSTRRRGGVVATKTSSAEVTRTGQPKEVSAEEKPKRTPGRQGRGVPAEDHPTFGKATSRPETVPGRRAARRAVARTAGQPEAERRKAGEEARKAEFKRSGVKESFEQSLIRVLIGESIWKTYRDMAYFFLGERNLTGADYTRVTGQKPPAGPKTQADINVDGHSAIVRVTRDKEGTPRYRIRSAGPDDPLKVRARRKARKAKN